MDREVERLCAGRGTRRRSCCARCPVSGPITALYFVLTIEDPSRFCEEPLRGSLSWGFAPSRGTLGEQQPAASDHEGQATGLLRSLLVSCGALHPGALRSGHGAAPVAGLRMAERGGQAAKKRGDRCGGHDDLAVLLHRLWVNGTEVYEPLRSEASKAA